MCTCILLARCKNEIKHDAPIMMGLSISIPIYFVFRFIIIIILKLVPILFPGFIQLYSLSKLYYANGAVISSFLYFGFIIGVVYAFNYCCFVFQCKNFGTNIHA